MTARERLFEISELNIKQKLVQMSNVQLYDYIKMLNSFIEKFPEKEEELKKALDANDYLTFSKHYASIRDMLINIHADELAKDCQKQIDGLINIKHEKVEAYMTYFLSTLAILSIDIQMAIYNDNNEEENNQIIDATAVAEEDVEKKSILAVDDNAFFLDTLKSALQDTDYKLICVTSGMAALKYLQNHRPNLYILDIEMPEMDGYELAHKIRTYGKKAPIIFLTGNSSKEYVTKAIQAGAADFIVKPLNKEYVLERISQHIKA
jgi:CheY-like chemotaxis protein/HPt (histidine-containing phosphotransfer) domain-containing protein